MIHPDFLEFNGVKIPGGGKSAFAGIFAVFAVCTMVKRGAVVVDCVATAGRGQHDLEGYVRLAGVGD
jgi:hypothetical protein